MAARGLHSGTPNASPERGATVKQTSIQFADIRNHFARWLPGRARRPGAPRDADCAARSNRGSLASRFPPRPTGTR
jgi:hypothetical protein